MPGVREKNQSIFKRRNGGTKMTTEAFGVLGYMMALMKMTNYKLKSADVIVLKNSCERLHNLLIQKADKPGDVDTGELDKITNDIVAGAMILYFGGGIDMILPQESGKSEPSEANEVTKKKPLFKMTKMKCPFCEGENSNARVYEDKQNKEYFVYCLKCGIETKDFFTSKEKAVKAFESGENRDIPKEELK
jgi:transcription elongation factor Elf1